METVINDENFKTEVGRNGLPVVVDFYATWCEPCAMLSLVLDKVAKDYEGRMSLLKVNLDDIPMTAQQFGINQIPTVVLFANGRPVSGFVGARPEEIVKEWLDQFLKQVESNPGMTESSHNEVEELLTFYANYAEQNGINLNPNAESVVRIINGLLSNQKKHGKRFCPCRRVSGNAEADEKNVCPCAYHKEEIERDGHCLCNLFVK